MANPTNAVGAFTKAAGLQIALVGSTTATGAVFEHKLRDMDWGVLPKPSRKLERIGYQGTGTPVAALDDYRLTPSRPTFTVNLPLTKRGVAIGLTSLMQYVGYDSGTTSYQPHVWEDPFVAPPLLMHLEAGIPGTVGAVYKTLGAIVKKIAIAVPPIDGSGGKPTMTWEVGAVSGSRLNAFSLTEITPAIDATLDGVQRSCDCIGAQISGSAAKFHSYEVVLENGATCEGVNLEAIPTAWALGDFVVSGSVTVLFTDQTGDEYYLLTTAHEAASSLVVRFPFAANSYCQHRLLFEEPEITRQGSICLAKFPFTAVDVAGTGTNWGAVIVTESDILNWAS